MHLGCTFNCSLLLVTGANVKLCLGHGAAGFRLAASALLQQCVYNLELDLNVGVDYVLLFGARSTSFG